MRFSAAFRSIIEAVAVLSLARILDDAAFARLITHIYPIYFTANLLFSSATVDFAGGQQRTPLTNVLLIFALPATMIMSLAQGETFRILYFALASLTAIESIAFVFCESIFNRTFLFLMLVPRALFLVSIILLLVLGVDLSLEVTIQLLFARDFVLVIIGAIVLFKFRHEFYFRTTLRAVKVSEIIYLLMSNSHDFVLRIVVGNLIGGGFLKEFEYALRLPKIAQNGLMLGLRHRIFVPVMGNSNSNRIMSLQIATGLVSVMVFYAYRVELLSALFMIFATALLATSAVPWYTTMLQKRSFIVLTTAQFISFIAAVLSAAVFADSYVSTFIMALVLFLFAFFVSLAGRNCGNSNGR